MKTFNEETIDNIDIFNQTEALLNITQPGTGLQTIRSIRFELGRDFYIRVNPDDILFAASADHYVKSMIYYGQRVNWAIKHRTLKDLLAVLPAEKFIRLNKFYLLNRNQFLYFDEPGKIFYFKHNISVPVIHRISPFILEMIRQ